MLCTDSQQTQGRRMEGTGKGCLSIVKATTQSIEIVALYLERMFGFGSNINFLVRVFV